MSRYPAFRTAPLPRPVGGAPIALGCAAVVVGIPALAWAALGLLAQARGQGIGRMMDTDGTGLVLLLVALAYSPLFSWVALLVLAPLQTRVARAGWGGWAVAMGTGLIAGLAVYIPVLLASGIPENLPDTLLKLVLPVGAVLGLAFWLGARLGGLGPSAPRARATG